MHTFAQKDHTIFSAMETRTRAAKKVVSGPDLHTLKGGEESLDSVDSGILSDSLTSSPISNKSEKSKKHGRKSSVQRTSSRSPKNLPDVDKENDGSRANASAIEESDKNDLPVENRRETRLKLRSAKTSTQKTSPKTIAAKSAEESEEKSVAEEEIKLSQCPSNYDSKQILKWLQSRRNVGLWIKCCQENCGKWRFNDGIHDPVDVPKMWYCDMQLDPRVAYCDYPQQVVPPDTLEDLIENKYNAGSIVWARLGGYPWWPAMVDDSPFTFRYYELGKASNIPIKYNVTFFAADRVECSWILDRNLQPYKGNPKEVFLKRKRVTYQGISYKDQVQRGCVMADVALQLPLYERLLRFSFVARSRDNALVENVERSTGSHSRTSPVMSRKTGAIQKEVSGDNLKTPYETTAQQTACTSTVSLQCSIETQKKSARPSTVASNNKTRSINKISRDETSTRQNASTFGKYPQTGVGSQKSIQGFSQVTLDNTRPKRSILQERTVQQTASTSKIDSQISADSQKGIQGFSQVSSNNRIPRRKVFSADGASNERNSDKIQPQTSFVNQTDNKRSNIRSPRMKNVSVDEPFMQNSGSKSRENQQTSIESKEGRKPQSQVSALNKTPGSRKSRVTLWESDQNDIELPQRIQTLSDFNQNGINTNNDEIKTKPAQNFQLLDELLNRLRPNRTIVGDNSTIPNQATAQQTISTSKIYTRTCVKSQEKSERLFKVASNNGNPGVKKIWCDDKSSNKHRVLSPKTISHASAEIRRKIESPSQIVSNNENLVIQKVSFCELPMQFSGPIFGEQQKISLDKNIDILRPPQTVSKNENSKIKKVSVGELPMRFSDSVFGVKQATSVERKNEEKRLSETVANNESSKLKKVPFCESPMLFSNSIFGEQLKAPFGESPMLFSDSDFGVQLKAPFGESPMLFSDSDFGVQLKAPFGESPMLFSDSDFGVQLKVPFGDSPMLFSDSDFGVQPETSVERKKEIKRPLQTVANHEGSKIKKVSIDQSSMQLSSGLNSGVGQQTSTQSKEKTKEHFQVCFFNQIPGIRKSRWGNLSPIQPPSTTVNSDQSIEMETDDKELSSYF